MRWNSEILMLVMCFIVSIRKVVSVIGVSMCQVCCILCSDSVMVSISNSVVMFSVCRMCM